MRYRDRLDAAALKRYANALNSRARAVGTSGTLDADALRGVILDSGGRCGWCGVSLMDVDFEVDHIASLHRGGDNAPANLAATCITCNRQKGDQHPARFARQKRAQGSDTALVRRVLAEHGADDAGVQLGLFDETPPRRVLGLDAPSDDDDAPDSPPPYRW